MFFSIYFQGKLLIFIIAFKLLSVSSSVSCILLILAKQRDCIKTIVLTQPLYVGFILLDLDLNHRSIRSNAASFFNQ